MAEKLTDMFFFESFVRGLARAIGGVDEKFEQERFVRLVFDEDWEGRELKARMRHVTKYLSTSQKGSMKSMKYLLTMGMFSLLCCLSFNSMSCDRTVVTKAYLFSYFKGNGEDGLHLAYSTDGLIWRPLNRDESFLSPTAGRDKLMRDPCIVRGPDDLFHMVWTVSWNEKGIGYAFSKDLIHWSDQKYIPVMEHEPGAQNCWAPEVFYDNVTEQYFIFWATTIPGRFPETDNQSNEGPPAPGRNHRIYCVTTKDFSEFSETRLLYDYGFNVIDATIVKDQNRYVMFLKDESNTPFETQKNIRIAFSDSAAGPYGPPSEPITGDYWAEGPTAIEMMDEWYVYFDKYRLNRFGLIVSADLKNWTEISDRMVHPPGMRHGTIFEVPIVVLDNLIREEKNG